MPTYEAGARTAFSTRLCANLINLNSKREMTFTLGVFIQIEIYLIGLQR